MRLQKFFPLMFILLSISARAQDSQPSPLSVYRDSYLLGGYDSSDLNNDLVVKYQISGKLETIVPNFYLAYTQRSFLDLSRKSFPFYDHNFSPEAFYQFPLSIKLGLNHQSNGRDREASRSWNRVYLEGRFKFDKFSIRPIIWFPFLKDDFNEDIEDFYGYGQMSVSYRWQSNTELSLQGRLGTKWGKGNVQANLSIPWTVFSAFSESGSSSNIWVQLWHGHGETLIGFRENSTAVAIGIGIREPN